MKKAFLRGIFSIVLSVLVLSSPQVRGAVYWDFDYGFNPYVVVISPGDTVYWVNYDLYGLPVQVTSDVLFGNPNYFLFLLVDFGDSYGVTFNNQGTFGYHSSYSQQGYVVVNIPPVVTITNPPNNAVFSAPATFTIEAAASETPDDIVRDVEFFLGTSGGTNSIIDDILAPFSASVTNLAAGTYTLIAIATDNYDATATNAITITVGSATPITLSAPRMSGGQFLFDVAGLTIGKTNVLQISTNLTAWTPVKTNVAASVSTTVTNTAVSGPHFYRVIQRL